MSQEQSDPARRGLLASIGPAIIVASVVVGPGSILASSKVGAQYGYSMAWVLVVAGVLMIGMVVLAGRLGVVLQGTVCDELASRLGRPVAALIGVVMFLVVAAFQSSNNIAVITAVEPMTEGLADGRLASVGMLVLLNGVVIAALYGSRSLYRPVETVMKALVCLMIVGFASNVFVARPSVAAVAAGLVPHLPDSTDWLPLLGLFATTFSVGGAFYQSYLVREKGWTTDDLGQGVIDSVIGIGVLCGITLVIMVTSATVLHGKNVELKTVGDVAQQLKPLFGPAASILFNVGLFAGALSSFLVNAMIGGTVMSDGFGLGGSMNQKWPKAFTVLALLGGMAVAIAATAFDVSRVGLIVFAQALTVVGVPLLAFALLYLGTRPDLVGKRAIPTWVKLLAGLGAVMTLVLACRTAWSVWLKFS